MKREVAKYVSECDICRRVKTSHLRPAGILQPLDIPSWKWEDISMDFIVGLPPTSKGYDSIWVIVDRLTKSAHFLPVKTRYSSHQYAEIYMAQIVSLHGVPKIIISDRGSQFVARFWEQLHVWQNHLNYPGSSAQAITIKATPAQMHFKRNNSWSVG